LASAENHLIELLPTRARSRLLAICEPFELSFTAVLCERGQTLGHVYFPVAGFVSLVAQIHGHPGLEVGMVGREGMVGAPLALGLTEAPLQALVQGAGHAHRVNAAAFQRELAQSPGLQTVMNRYLGVLMAQLASSAACLRFHLIAPRLARWLLMSQDRAQADRFCVTHEFLALMLGVRRVGITNAAGGLQRDGLIQYRRGELQVIDRGGLEAVACSCYADDCATYAAALG
jgi:CRP-like cAMP-binding protein